jgi:hypothetical protein
VTEPALARLRAIYDDPYQPGNAWRVSGGKVVGCLGPDVPVEIVDALGMLPVRLRGRPGAATPRADLLGAPPDLQTRSIMQRLLDGDYGLDALLIDHSSHQHVPLFKTLVEVQRAGLSESLAPIYFFDLLHLPNATSAHYNQVRGAELVQQLEQWAGRRLEESNVRSAFAVRQRNRARIAEMAELRRSGRMSGAEVLVAIAVEALVPPSQFAELAVSALAEAQQRPTRAIHPVVVSGSGQDSLEDYAAIEAAGATIVGDDHSWGPPVEIPHNPGAWLAPLLAGYAHSRPTGTKYPIQLRAAHTARLAVESGAKAVIVLCRQGEEGSPWDYPATARLLDAHQIAHQQLLHLPYGSESPDLAVVVSKLIAPKQESAA